MGPHKVTSLIIDQISNSAWFPLIEHHMNKLWRFKVLEICISKIDLGISWLVGVHFIQESIEFTFRKGMKLGVVTLVTICLMNSLVKTWVYTHSDLFNLTINWKNSQSSKCIIDQRPSSALGVHLQNQYVLGQKKRF